MEVAAGENITISSRTLSLRRRPASWSLLLVCSCESHGPEPRCLSDAELALRLVYFVVWDNNHIQIEIGSSGEAREVVVSHFPLGTLPASYQFSVAEVGQITEILFRAKDSPGVFMQRTRLNGFTLVSVVPEPETEALLLLAALAHAGVLLLRRR